MADGTNSLSSSPATKKRMSIVPSPASPRSRDPKLKDQNEDLHLFLKNSGLDFRSSFFFKNPVSAFSDGLLVAELIHSRYPQVVSLHGFSEKGDMEGKIAQWRQLLRRPLKLLGMILTDEEVLKIVCNQVNKEDVFSFLRQLQSKLVDYADGKQKNISNLDSKKSGVIPSQKRDISSTPNSAPHTPVSINKKLPSTSATKKYLSTFLKKQEVSKVASKMSEDEIEKLYLSFSEKLRVASLTQMKINDEIQMKSDQLHAHFLELKEINVGEMQKVNKRLGLLEQELKAAEMGSAFLTTLVSENEDGDFRENSAARRAREITKAILNIASTTLPAAPRQVGDTIPKPLHFNPHIEEVVHHPQEDSSSSQLSHNTLHSTLVASNSRANHVENPLNSIDQPSCEVWEMKVENDAKSTTKEEDDLEVSSVCPFRPPSHLPTMHWSADHLEKNANTSSTIDVSLNETSVEVPHLQHDPPGTPSTPKLITKNETQSVLLYTRFFDPGHKRNYYVNKATGHSQWTVPAKGVIICTDSNKNTFYTNVETGKSAWSLPEVA